jgi:outer membrane protein assembly factor BamB
MDDGSRPLDADVQLDRWLREEVEMPAPDRLLEDVFARTESARQVHRGWRGRLVRTGRSDGHAGVARLQRGLAGMAAVVVVGLIGVSIGTRLEPGVSGTSATPTPTVSTGSPAPTSSLRIQRTHATCGQRYSDLVALDATATRASAWVTCGPDSDEIVLGTDTVTRRPGLGAVAADGAAEWAVKGDSVVQLNPDRSIARSVRIGTPAAIAAGSGVVWALDVLTGTLHSIGTAGIERSVTPVPGGRPIALTIAAGSLWVLDQTGAQVLRLDVHDGHRTLVIPVAANPVILVSAAGALYVASPATETIVRIDPSSGTATTLRPDLGEDGHLDALGGSSTALLLGSRSGVYRLDPATTAPSLVGIGPGYVDAVGLSGSTILVLTDGFLSEAELP